MKKIFYFSASNECVIPIVDFRVRSLLFFITFGTCKRCFFPYRIICHPFCFGRARKSSDESLWVDGFFSVVFFSVVFFSVVFFLHGFLLWRYGLQAKKDPKVSLILCIRYANAPVTGRPMKTEKLRGGGNKKYEAVAGSLSRGKNPSIMVNN